MIQPIETYRACIEEADNEFVLIVARNQPNGWYPGYSLGPVYGLIQYAWLCSVANDAVGPFRDRKECFDYAMKSLNERIEQSLKLPDIPEKIADMLRARQITAMWMDESLFDVYDKPFDTVRNYTTHEFRVGRTYLDVDFTCLDERWHSKIHMQTNTAGQAHPFDLTSVSFEKQSMSIHHAINEGLDVLASYTDEADVCRLIKELKAYQETLTAEQTALF